METWLLLPGTLCQSEVFDPLLTQPRLSALLAASEPVAAYRAATAEAAAQRILARAPDEFSVLAFSLGAFVALELARAAGSRMRRMVLTGATARADRTENWPGRLRLCQDLAGGNVDDIVRRTLWPGYVAPARYEDETLFTAIAHMARNTPPADLADQTSIALTRRDFRPYLPQLNLPVLILHGTEDAATPPSRGAEMVGLLPRAEAHVISGAGHFALMEKPAEMASLLVNWLTQKGTI